MNINIETLAQKLNFAREDIRTHGAAVHAGRWLMTGPRVAILKAGATVWTAIEVPPAAGKAGFIDLAWYPGTTQDDGRRMYETLKAGGTIADDPVFFEEEDGYKVALRIADRDGATVPPPAAATANDDDGSFM